MRCTFDHDHPPREVVAATWNDSEPLGARPYHCRKCREVTKARTVESNWETYATAAAAAAVGHKRPCAVCFPAAARAPAPTPDAGASPPA